MVRAFPSFVLQPQRVGSAPSGRICTSTRAPVLRCPCVPAPKRDRQIAARSSCQRSCKRQTSYSHRLSFPFSHQFRRLSVPSPKKPAFTSLCLLSSLPPAAPLPRSNTHSAALGMLHIHQCAEPPPRNRFPIAQNGRQVPPLLALQCVPFFASALPAIPSQLFRAANSRDLTVPTGISKISASSAYDCPSTSRSQISVRCSSGSRANASPNDRSRFRLTFGRLIP